MTSGWEVTKYKYVNGLVDLLTTFGFSSQQVCYFSCKAFEGNKWSFWFCVIARYLPNITRLISTFIYLVHLVYLCRNLKYPLLIKQIRYGFKLQSSWNLFYPLISLGFKQEKLEWKQKGVLMRRISLCGGLMAALRYNPAETKSNQPKNRKRRTTSCSKTFTSIIQILRLC